MRVSEKRRTEVSGSNISGERAPSAATSGDDS